MSDGGALYSMWGVGLLRVEGGSRLRGNWAGGFGGAIAVHSSVGRLEVRGGSSLTRNNASTQDGGAVFIRHNATEIFIAEGSELSSNAATFWGGAIKVGQEDADGQTVRGTGYVGRLVVESGSQLRRNYAGSRGGAIHFNGDVGSIIINASYVEQNAAGDPASTDESNGGAFSTRGGVGELLLDYGASLTNNSAGTWGGAVYSEGTLERMVLDRGSSISYNTVLQANSFGGAVASLYINTFVTSSIELLRGSRMVGNTAPGAGGAVVLVGALGSLVVDGGSVLEGNEACLGGAFHVVEGIDSIAFTNGSRVAANMAKARCTNAHGGAVSSEGPVGSVVISGGSNVTRNSATVSGGVIHCNSRLEEFLVTGGSVLTRNAAGVSGGVLAVNGSVDSFVISGGSFVEGNTAGLEGGAFVIGGVGVRTNMVQRIEVAGSVLWRNNASMGGVLHVRGRTGGVLIRASDVSNNTAPYLQTNDASGCGGAMYFGGRVGNFTIDNGTRMQKNSAERGGGALRFAGGLGAFTLAGKSNISHNWAWDLATASGGAVNVGQSLGLLEIASGSSVENNTAPWLGGAFYIDNRFDSGTTVHVDGSARVLLNVAASGVCWASLKP